MKKIILLSLGITFSFSLHGQVLGRFYYNEKGQLVKQDSAKYFRVCAFDTTHLVFAGIVRDYTSNGRLIMTGKYGNGKRNGEFIFYYTNGKIESNGVFLDNRRVGSWKYFYPNGKEKQEVEFADEVVTVTFSGDGSSPKNFRILYFKDSLGKTLMENGTGFWREEYDGFWSRKIFNEGNFKDYKLDGEWKSGSSDGTVWYTQVYKNGGAIETKVRGATGNLEIRNTHFRFALLPELSRLTVMENFSRAEGVDESNYKFLKKAFNGSIPGIGTNEIFSVVEVTGEPTCGIQAFYKELSRLLEYQKRESIKCDGRTYVEFVINKDGSLSDFKVVKGAGKNCDELAIRVIQQSQQACKWLPAVQMGKPVRQRYSLPVLFGR